MKSANIEEADPISVGSRLRQCRYRSRSAVSTSVGASGRGVDRASGTGGAAQAVARGPMSEPVIQRLAAGVLKLPPGR